MNLLLATSQVTLNRASTRILTALLAAMRVFALNGFHALTITKCHRFTDMNDPEKRQVELLEIATDGTAHAESIADQLLEQINEIAYIRTTETRMTIVTHHPT